MVMLMSEVGVRNASILPPKISRSVQLVNMMSRKKAEKRPT